MATLEKLRNRAGTLVAVVIGLALLAFILGDLFGSGGSLFTRNQFEIAEIDGNSIPYQNYQERVDYLTELNKASRRQSALDEQTMESIREEVWNGMVQEHVLGDKYKSLGIAISTDELFDLVQGRNIHPIIRQEFGDRQTGEVDPTLVVQFLKNMEADPSGLQKQIWLYLESLIIRDRLFTKYNNLIGKGLAVTGLQAEQSLESRSKRVDFNYLVGRYSSINDSTITVTDSEIKSYYSKHKNEFKQQAARDVEYVVFPINPSQDDYVAAEKWINEIKNDFVTAVDPVQFTNLNSDIPFDGTFFKKGEFPNEEIDQWAFGANVGDTLGPIFSDDSYKIAYLVQIAQLPDSVKARHILIGPEGNTQEDYNAAKAKSDSLMALVNSRNFAKLAEENSQDPGSASMGGDLGWFNDGAMVKPFNDACFEGKKGDIVLVESQFGFHIIEILDKGVPAKKVQIAVLERDIVPSTRTYQTIYQKASEFAGLQNTYDKFIDAVQDQKLAKRLASNLKEADRIIAGLENPRELVRWAYKSNAKEVSPVFEFGDNFIVATLKSVKEDGTAPIEQVKDQIKAEVIKDKKAEILLQDFSAAKNNAASIDDIAADLSLAVQNASRISFASFSLPSVGFEPAVIAAAVGASEGDIAGPIKGNSGVYLLSVTAVNIDEGDIDS
ncbi:MAG: SurA N-terminal domain-containing protein, partial [Bacteroidales bacterium]|nr:SurA N-terminal domain-containing protein [Bacteroidales bacterium]